MIYFSNVTKTYENGTTALNNVSFHIEKGEFVFVVGPSGAGKSTLTRLLMHEELPTSGSIIIDGKWRTEQRQGKTLIVFYEIPYGVKIEYEEQGKPKGIIPQLRKAIAEEKISDVEDVRDESSKNIRIVVECAADVDLDRTINQIYSETDLRKSFSANYVALVGKTPKLLNLKQAIDIYIDHNLSCIKREFEFEIERA